MKHERQRAGGLGRPRKFAGPSKVITVTLPESTLFNLETIDRDRARAIVRASEVARAATQASACRAVELIAVTPETAVIIVPDVEALQEIDGLNLIQIQPTRNLVVLEPGTPLAAIEVALQDKVEAAAWGTDERGVLEEFLSQLRVFRRTQRSRKAELILVDI